jgi:pteridine reductase
MSEIQPPEHPVALVTGGAIRVGRAIVESLAEAGYRVWVHYNRSLAPATELVDQLGESALGPVGADLADEAAREGLVGTVLDPGGPAGGRLDLLVNNAASFERAGFLERTDADFRRVLETNLVAPVSLARSLAAALRDARGNIVNIVDLGAFHPWPRFLDHCCAKAGLAMATRALALELSPEVRVNAIAPGTVTWPPDSEHAEGSPERARILSNIPLGQIGEPADVARTVLFMAQSPHLDGQVLALDGGRLANFGR